MFLALNRSTHWDIGEPVSGTITCSHKLSDYKINLPVDDGDSHWFLYTYTYKCTKKDANFVRIHLNPDINAEEVVLCCHNSDVYKTVVVKNYHFQDNNYLFEVEDLLIGISTTVYADAQNFFLESWKQIRPATRIFI